MIRRNYEYLCGLLLLLAVLVNASEIVFRLGFNVSYDLFYDFSVWLTVWALVLIAGPLLLEGGHVAISFLMEKASGKKRMLLMTLNFMFTFFFGLIYTIAGGLYVASLYERQAVFPRFVAIPMWLVEICIPVGMGLFTIFSIVAFLRAIRNKPGT